MSTKTIAHHIMDSVSMFFGFLILCAMIGGLVYGLVVLAQSSAWPVALVLVLLFVVWPIVGGSVRYLLHLSKPSSPKSTTRQLLQSN